MAQEKRTPAEPLSTTAAAGNGAAERSFTPRGIVSSGLQAAARVDQKTFLTNPADVIEGLHTKYNSCARGACPKDDVGGRRFLPNPVRK